MLREATHVTGGGHIEIRRSGFDWKQFNYIQRRAYVGHPGCTVV